MNDEAIIGAPGLVKDERVVGGGTANGGPCRMHDGDFDYAELDPGIAMAVRTLREAGVETIWSCEGGDGHAYAEPTIVFRGDVTEVHRVVSLAREARLGPYSVTRSWYLENEEFPENPVEASGLGEWTITLSCKSLIDARQARDHAQQEQSIAERLERDVREVDRRRNELFPKLLTLEPRLEALYRKVIAGGIDLNDLWLTYFSHLLQWVIGINRQEGGDELLFTDEALDAAVNGLLDAVPIGQARALEASAGPGTQD
jgi:hypothetical protein